MKKSADAMSGDHTLTSLLDRLVQRTGEEKVSAKDLVDTIGHRAFPALILVPALVITSPASGIPGLSALGGVTIAIVASQYVWGRKSVWLPKFILKRTLPSSRLNQAIGFLRPPSGWIDRILRSRLTFLADKPFSQVLAIVITLLGLIMPLLEFVPFSSSIVAAVISIFSLALLFRDGVLTLWAMTILLGGGYAVYSVLLL